MKRKVILVVFSLILIFMMVGCGEKEELETTPSQSIDELISIGSETENGECPEGYVYDYQVSMEPIPEEIAALGGEVCGTIHAYPTEIKAALLEEEIENSTELQEQHNRNVQGIEKYLKETYGGEFEIKPIEKYFWEYGCKELDTGKEFSIEVERTFSRGFGKNAISIDKYDYEDTADIYREGLKQIIEEVILDESVYRIRCQTVNEVWCLDLFMAVFCDNEPNYLEEQKKIIRIFDIMKQFQKETANGLDLNLVITYFPITYKEVISKQYESKLFDDIQYINDSNISILQKSNEVYSQFRYLGVIEANQENSLDNIADDKEEFWENQYILPYWRGVNE